MSAPYESSITTAFTALGEWAGLLEAISPAITSWIEAKIPLEKQRIMDRRIRRCKRKCRKGGYNAGMILSRVNLDFPDLSDSLKADLVNLLDSELNR